MNLRRPSLLAPSLFRAFSPPPPAAMAAPDDAAFAAFMAWMRREGFRWDDAQLHLAPRGTAAGAGVLARRAIAAGDAVCHMPKAAALTVRTTAAAALLHENGVRGGLGRLRMFSASCGF